MRLEGRVDGVTVVAILFPNLGVRRLGGQKKKRTHSLEDMMQQGMRNG